MPGNPLHAEVTADSESYVSAVEMAKNSSERLGDQAIDTAGAMQVLQGRADEAEDEIDSAGRSATAASVRFAGLSVGAGSLTSALATLSLAAGGTTAALAALSTTLLPLSVVLGGVVGAAASLAAVFGGLGAAGVATHMQELKDAFAAAREEVMVLIDPLGDVFGPLLVDAVQAIPAAVASILEALGPLGQFRDTLAEMGETAAALIPRVTTLLFNLAERALPVLNNALNGLTAASVSNAVSRLADVFWAAYPPVADFASAVADLIGPATRLGTLLVQTLLPPLTRTIRLAGDAAGEVTAFATSSSDLVTNLRALGATLRNSVFGALSKATATWADWNQAFDGLPNQIALTGAAVAALAAGASSAIAAVGGLSGIVAGLGAAVGALTSPIALAVAAVTGLAVAWQRNLFGIQQTTKRILGAVGSVIKAGLARIQTFWQRNGDQITSTVAGAFNTVRKTIESVLTFIWSNVHKPILNRIQAFWDRHGETILRTIQQAFATIQSTIQSVLSFVESKLIRPTLSRLEALWNRHGQTLMREAGATFNHIRSVIQDFVAFVEPFVDVFLAGLEAGFKAWVAVVTTLWNTFGDEIMTAAKFAFGTISTVVGQATDTILTTIRTVLALIRGDWDQAFSLIEGLTERTFKRLTSHFRGWRSTVTSVVSGLVTGVVGLGKDLATGLYNAISGGFQDIASYIRNDAAGDLASAARSAGESAANALTSAFNRLLPDDLSIPQITVGGGSLNIPPATINIPEILGGGSKTIGGGSLGIPTQSVGGQSLDLPHLNTGGLIDEGGLAMLHAGERVVPASQVSDRGEVVVDGGADAEELAGAIERAGQSEAIVRELQQTRRAIVQLGEEFDITVEQGDGRYHPRGGR